MSFSRPTEKSNSQYPGPHGQKYILSTTPLLINASSFGVIIDIHVNSRQDTEGRRQAGVGQVEHGKHVLLHSKVCCNDLKWFKLCESFKHASASWHSRTSRAPVLASA